MLHSLGTLGFLWCNLEFEDDFESLDEDQGLGVDSPVGAGWSQEKGKKTKNKISLFIDTYKSYNLNYC